MRSVTQRAQNDNDDLVAVVSAALERAVTAKGETSFAGRERVALAVSNEAVRRMLERELQRAADVEVEEIRYEDRSYRPHHLGTVKYHSLCGPLHIRRWAYRAMGVRNGPTLVPLELRAGLIEHGTPALAYAVTQGYAKGPIRAVRQDLLAAERLPPSRPTLERMAKRVALSAKEAVDLIEPEIRAAEEIPPQTMGVTLGLDRTTVPMEEPASEEELARGKKIAVHYRMAYVGTIALTDRAGDVLRSWRYAIPAHEDPAIVTDRMMNDLQHALQHKPRVHIGVVQDGAPELWRLIDEALEKWKLGKKRLHRAIDMFHLCERLSRALEIAYPKKSGAHLRAKMLTSWKRALLRRDDAIKNISDFFEVGPRFHARQYRRTVRDAASKGFFKTRDHYFVDRPDKPRPPAPAPLPPPRFSAQQRHALSALLDGYLIDPKMFRYASMAKLGLHVGSGLTEGACKSLIAARTKRSGQRWHKPGIEAVLTVRSLLESDRFDLFWGRFSQRYAPLASAA
ncbi:hypothetical protein BH09MYX1_BH09MYX1_67710 [soil metagenome]